MQQNPHIPTDNMPIRTVRFFKQIYKHKAFHLPVSLNMYLISPFTELEHNFQTNSEAESIIGYIIPSACQQMQSSTKNQKHRRRTIGFSNGVLNLLQWAAVEILTYCCRFKSSSMRTSNSPLFLEILAIRLSTNAYWKAFPSLEELVI